MCNGCFLKGDFFFPNYSEGDFSFVFFLMSKVAFNGKVYTFKVPFAAVYLQSSRLQMQILYLLTIILEPGPAFSSPRAQRTVKPPSGTIRHDKHGGTGGVQLTHL